MVGHGRDGEAAFDALFHQLFPRALAIARRLSGDPQVAEDLTAEAFAALLRPVESVGGSSLRRRLGAPHDHEPGDRSRAAQEPRCRRCRPEP